MTTANEGRTATSSSLVHVLHALDLGEPCEASLCQESSSRSLESPTSSLNALSSPGDGTTASSKKDAPTTVVTASEESARAAQQGDRALASAEGQNKRGEETNDIDADLSIVLEALRKARVAHERGGDDVLKSGEGKRGEEKSSSFSSPDTAESSQEESLEALAALLLSKLSKRKERNCEQALDSVQQCRVEDETGETALMKIMDRVKQGQSNNMKPDLGGNALGIEKEASSGSQGSDKGSVAGSSDEKPRTGPVHNSLYKTELCRSFEEFGTCRYGNKCQFAHGAHELRPVQRHPKYKTEVCRTFATTGTCPYGTRCRFIHRNDTIAQLNAARNSSSLSTPGASSLLSTPNQVYPLETLQKSPLAQGSDAFSVFSSNSSPANRPQVSSNVGTLQGHCSQTGLSSPFIHSDSIFQKKNVASGQIESHSEHGSGWGLFGGPAGDDQIVSQVDKLISSPSSPGSLNVGSNYEISTKFSSKDFSTPPASPLPGCWSHGLGNFSSVHMTTPTATPTSEIGLASFPAVSPIVSVNGIFRSDTVMSTPKTPADAAEQKLNASSCISIGTPTGEGVPSISRETVTPASMSTPPRRLPVFSGLIGKEGLRTENIM